jgi:hypothetical protein
MLIEAPLSLRKKHSDPRSSERGAALITSILILGMLSAVALTVLAVVQKESQIAGSDLKRTQTFYAAAASIEKMTSDFNKLFLTTSRPTPAQFYRIQNSPPPELVAEGFTILSPIGVDGNALDEMRKTQGLGNDAYPRVTVPGGPFNGLSASVTPYLLGSIATANDGTQVSLIRQMNNYLIPIFQFGMFSNKDIELHPGPAFAFNGRVHANGNLYVNGNVTFSAKVTTANELIHDVIRNGTTRTGTVSMKVDNVTVPLTMGSMFGGPNIVGSSDGQRGFFPGSPNGSINSAWDSISVGPATTGVPNQFGGQLQTRTTGVQPLLLPLQLKGKPTWEIIRRRMPGDLTEVSDSRYHSKAQIRVLIDDESPSTSDAAGIPAGEGVSLLGFSPMPLPNAAASAQGGRALWRVKDDGTYSDSVGTCVLQELGGSPNQALTVRGSKGASETISFNGDTTIVPAGAGLSGRILIQITDDDGNVFDVTREVLSMGITYGEPNSIVTLQRPLWAAFVQGSRDATASQNTAPDGTKYFNNLVDIADKTYIAADGELETTPGPIQDGTYGYLTNLVDDDGVQPERADSTPYLDMSDWGTAGWNNSKRWNAIVPINIYNVREGCITAANCGEVFERGITSVVEVNMKNLARWVSGVYDENILKGTSAVSTNIADRGGYTLYISDRRGDKVKPMFGPSGAPINSTNGMVDNEDIYGPNNQLDNGEDVQETGALIKDTSELPDPAILAGSYGADTTKRALTVAVWSNPNIFRRSVRLFNGEDLQVPGGPLSPTKGISVSTENMIYIWGNYNTTGINLAPPDGTSSLNDLSETYHYLGDQIPASIIADAFFPLSKTWSDNASAMYPGDLSRRLADRSLPAVTDETSIRTAIIAGNNLSALAGNPDAGNTGAGESRLNGGMHNFPRFLERWRRRWNFVGSLVPLYHSSQALGQYNADSTIYSPPIRNWAFDSSFLNPDMLPPSTPQFQYIQPTAFRQIL